MAFLEWLTNLQPITWVRESDSQLGYTLYLALHTIGMVALVGPTLVIATRVLGLAPGLPIKPLASFRPIITMGFWITLVTGTVLFATAPVGYVKNITFVVKILSLVIGLAFLPALLREFFDRTPDPDAHPISARTRRLTLVVLATWAVGIVAGRLTAYSYVVVLESLKAAVVLAVVVAALIWIGRPLKRRTANRAVFPMDIHPAAAKGGK